MKKNEKKNEKEENLYNKDGYTLYLYYMTLYCIYFIIETNM
jgi:hypothetical protein